MAEIQTMYDRLGGSSSSSRSQRLLVLPLHSTIPSSEQKRIFDSPPNGVRKVVLATNIAETSITVNDVVYVIDCGKVKENQYDPATRMTSLVQTWVSKASARQRRGRAGRVRAGKCFRLYTKRKHESFIEQQPPEMLRVPLEQLCLQIKVLGYGEPLDFLRQALEPPPSEQVASALDVLYDISAISREGGDVTALGRHLATLPVDVRIGKMVIFGSVLGCADATLTIAATLSTRSPFVSPMDKREEANRARQSFAIGKSDHLTVLRAFNEWISVRQSGNDRAFLEQNFLSGQALRNIVDLKAQYAQVLRDLGFNPKANANATNARLLKAIVCAGLYPNVVGVDLPDTKYMETLSGSIAKDHNAREIKLYTKHDRRVWIHPASVNFVATDFETRLLVFLEKVRTNKVFIRDSTMISAIALLMFGGDIAVNHQFATVTVDRWIDLKAPARTAVLMKEMRKLLDKVLERKLAEPNLDISRNVVVHTVVQLLAQE
mmetsp:Transcript_39452/g.63966  ORF Transcript_39452/g.63966 Transcript_39452/m.63966 type:complete len:491 (-) Transcript_39452:183-1655(-)